MARYARKVVNEIRYNTREVFAAACAAQRVNGEYLKQGEYDEQGDQKRIANKYLTLDFLNSKFDIRDEDRELSEHVIRHFQSLTFKILQGDILSEFESKAMACSNSEDIGLFEVGLISSLPSYYLRNRYLRNEAKAVVNRRIRDAVGHIGQVGDKVQLELEVLHCTHSQRWDTFFITGITPDNKSVFFSFKRLIAKGTTMNIEGKVKAHRDDSTQLNYVKVM
jgi:hypothetical protein